MSRSSLYHLQQNQRSMSCTTEKCKLPVQFRHSSVIELRGREPEGQCAPIPKNPTRIFPVEISLLTNTRIQPEIFMPSTSFGISAGRGHGCPLATNVGAESWDVMRTSSRSRSSSAFVSSSRVSDSSTSSASSFGAASLICATSPFILFAIPSSPP